MKRPLRLLVLVIAGLGLACHDKGTEPGPVKYNVYVAALDWVDGVATDPLFILGADSSLEVIDSIPRIGSLYDMEVSPDGCWLYTFVHRPARPCPNDSLRCIDVKNQRIDWAIPSPADTRFSLLDEGNLILRRSAGCGDLLGGQELLDATTGRILRKLPDSLTYMEGPVAGTRVAAISGEGYGATVVAVDLLTDEVSGSFVPRLPSGQELVTKFARLHPDGETVLVIAGVVTNLAWAMIGNLQTGESPLGQRIYDINSVGEFSSDGSLAVVSDMNSGLTVLDLDSMVYRGRVAVAAGQVAFVGDTKSVVVCGPGDYFHATNPIVLIDAAAVNPIWGVQLPLPHPLLGAMAVGRRP